jgi:hypothetical protein
LWQCDLADRFALAPITDDSEQTVGGHRSVSFSPDGRWIWYVLLTPTRYELRRRPLGGGAPETLLALDRARPEFGGRAITGARWLSFSHDGRRLLSVINLEGTGRFDSRAILTNPDHRPREDGVANGVRDRAAQLEQQEPVCALPGPEGRIPDRRE